MAALEKAFPGAARRLAAEAGLEAEMFCIVSGLKLPEPDDKQNSLSAAC